MANQRQYNRRLQDGIESNDPQHKLNLDRRIPNSDRRRDFDPSYSGPSRRQMLDRRTGPADRRGIEM